MKVEDFKGIMSTRSLRRTGATAIAQSGRPDAVQLGMSITGHKSIPMFEKYVQKVRIPNMVAEQVKKCLVTVHPTYPCGCVGGGLDGCEVRLCLPCARVRPCVPAPPGVSIHITICVQSVTVSYFTVVPATVRVTQ
jgi:hypothetical protein